MRRRGEMDRSGRGAAGQRRVAALALVLAVGFPGAADLSGGAPRQDPLPRPLPVPSSEAPAVASARDAAAWAAAERGLAWLAAEQGKMSDGSWPRGEAQVPAPLAVTALCSLAFLAGGNGLDRGPYGAHLTRSIDYLLARVDRDPRSAQRGYISTPGDGTSRMHGHGYAAHALAEAYAVSPRSTRGRELLELLPLAVNLIQRTQGPEGAWWYDPWVSVEHEGSVTITLVQALRAAKSAGLAVDARVISAADDYVRRSQTADGSFAYHLGSERTSVALTAAAIATLNATGSYDDPVIRSGVDAIWRGLEKRGGSRSGVEFPFYERLYLAQALWQLSDPSHFERWYEDELRVLLASQREDGSWHGATYGDAYATAMNALTLMLPSGLLPSFAR